MTKHCLSTNEIQERLQSAGVQPTLQRMAICKYVLCEADHPTADDVKAWADANLGKISQATVYNTLNTLVDAGILKEFRFNHSEKVVYDCNTHDHFHFVDEKTGKIYDIDPEDVKIDISIPKKFKIKDIKLIFKGEIK
ncbi:Fur family transcriptional regulator [Bdellovibrio sp. 22V]|uniref:Fur family transcriptional regulator n=1 Tax=Bdellovibrio TaxID=958 RepID=UPI002543357C|nr:Fur family transcriptional regulator [Bdellovibrio sp. 22V]WII73710.1 Fur family transcriptional regulator [Bdellovibrio sp. 22V]